MEQFQGIIGIRVWKAMAGLNSRKIAKEYGCSEPFASFFFKGEKTSKGLVDFLINKGCPEKYFKNGRVIVPVKRERTAA